MAATLKGAAEAAHNWKAGLGADRHLTTNRQGLWLFLRSASVYVLLFLGAFLLPYAMDAQRVLVDHAFVHRSVVCGGP